MAGVMLAQLSDANGAALEVTTAGTHALEGQPMGMRTKAAIASLEVLDTSLLGRHRSHQLVTSDCHRADLVIAMEADHVRYVRRIHPEASAKTATIWHLAEHLVPSDLDVIQRIERLDLAAVTLEGARDVRDPAGLDQDEYDRCAQEIWSLTQVLFEGIS